MRQLLHKLWGYVSKFLHRNKSPDSIIEAARLAASQAVDEHTKRLFNRQLTVYRPYEAQNIRDAIALQNIGLWERPLSVEGLLGQVHEHERVHPESGLSEQNYIGVPALDVSQLIGYMFSDTYMEAALTSRTMNGLWISNSSWTIHSFSDSGRDELTLHLYNDHLGGLRLTLQRVGPRSPTDATIGWRIIAYESQPLLSQRSIRIAPSSPTGVSNLQSVTVSSDTVGVTPQLITSSDSVTVTSNDPTLGHQPIDQTYAAATNLNREVFLRALGIPPAEKAAKSKVHEIRDGEIVRGSSIKIAEKGDLDLNVHYANGNIHTVRARQVDDNTLEVTSMLATPGAQPEDQRIRLRNARGADMAMEIYRNSEAEHEDL